MHKIYLNVELKAVSNLRNFVKEVSEFAPSILGLGRPRALENTSTDIQGVIKK